MLVVPSPLFRYTQLFVGTRTRRLYGPDTSDISHPTRVGDFDCPGRLYHSQLAFCFFTIRTDRFCSCSVVHLIPFSAGAYKRFRWAKQFRMSCCVLTPGTLIVRHTRLHDGQSNAVSDYFSYTLADTQLPLVFLSNALTFTI